MHIEAPTIETDRLVLRAYELSDFPPIRDMWADTEVVKFISDMPRAEEDAWPKFLRMVGHWRLLGYGFWIVEEKTSAVVIGEIGFADFKRALNLAENHAPEMGWAFATAAHGKGYATEAAKAALSWWDKSMSESPVWCLIGDDNAGSIRVAEKCGFVETKSVEYHGRQSLLFRRD